MAWIVKNSAGATIDRREEAYLNEAMKKRLEKEVLWRYPTRQAATLPVLHEIQHEYNWIPPQAIEETAAFLGLSPAQVMDTASFYDDFFLQPKGRHLIMVCQSLSCEIMGHGRLLDALREKLDIEPGDTTRDGKFTLRVAECLGSCGTAPCALFNETLHENLTLDNLDEILNSLE